MKLSKILYYLSIGLIALGLCCLIAAIFTKGGISDILYGASSILGVAALVVLFIRLNHDANLFNGENSPKPKVVVKVVDVKEVTKTKEQKLFEQYEELYKQNLITKEDLENKRKELLG